MSKRGWIVCWMADAMKDWDGVTILPNTKADKATAGCKANVRGSKSLDCFIWRASECFC
jgi:hypothetical protein